LGRCEGLFQAIAKIAQQRSTAQPGVISHTQNCLPAAYFAYQVQRERHAGCVCGYPVQAYQGQLFLYRRSTKNVQDLDV